jgi:hypothetical protein
MVGWMKNNKLERIWNKAVMAYLMYYPLHLPGGTEENHDKYKPG